VVFEDVIHAYPNVHQHFMQDFFQELTTVEWGIYGSSIRQSLLNGLKIAVKGLLRGAIR